MTGPYGAPSWFAESHQRQGLSSDRVRVASRRVTPQSCQTWGDLSEVDLNEVDHSLVVRCVGDQTPSDFPLTAVMFRVHRHDGGGHHEKVGLLSASHHDGGGHHEKVGSSSASHHDEDDHHFRAQGVHRVIRNCVPGVHRDSNAHPNCGLDGHRASHSYVQFGPRRIRNCAWGDRCSGAHRARDDCWFAIHRVPAAHHDERVRCCRDEVDWSWGARHRDAGVRLHEERDCGLRYAMRDEMSLVPNCVKRGHGVEPVRALRHKPRGSIPHVDRRCR